MYIILYMLYFRIVINDGRVVVVVVVVPITASNATVVTSKFTFKTNNTVCERFCYCIYHRIACISIILSRFINFKYSKIRNADATEGY